MAVRQPPLFLQPRQSLGATRTSLAATEQVAPIRQEQSLALIQESLSACIGTLAYVRGLFRADCFVLKRLSTAPNLQRQLPLLSQKPGGGDAVSFLRPGVSLESDQLLEWLEKGIFHALRDGFLEALQLGIYLDQTLPEQVIESYTFSFSYDHGLLVSDLSGKRVSLGDATRSAQQLTRSLLTLTNALPPLPDIRWLNVRMYYRRGTPDDYDPPGFRRLEPGSNRLFFDLDNYSELIKQTCGSIDAGYYALSMRVSNVSGRIASAGSGRRRSRFSFVDEDIDLPVLVGFSGTKDRDSRQPEYPVSNNHTTEPPGIERSATSAVLLQEKSPQSRVIAEPVGWTNTLETSQYMENRDAPSALNDGHEQATIGLVLSPLTITGGAAGVIPSSRDEREKAAINRMLMPLSQEADNVVTQPLGFSQKQHALNNSNPPVTSRPRMNETGALSSATDQMSHVTSKRSAYDSGGLDEPTRKRSKEESFDEIMLSTAKSRMVLSAAKFAEIRKRGKAKARRKHKKRGVKSNVSCECGCWDDEGSMVQCDACDKWQHAPCYGFMLVEEIARLDRHFCYSCLLNRADERELLSQMEGLAKFRRALYYIWNEGKFPERLDIFANEIGCDNDAATHVLNQLEEQGFATPRNKTSSQNLYKRDNQLQYEVIKTPYTRGLISQKYFDPWVHISHYYEPRKIPAARTEETPPSMPTPSNHSTPRTTASVHVSTRGPPELRLEGISEANSKLYVGTVE